MPKLVIEYDDESYEIPNAEEFDKFVTDDDLKEIYYHAFVGNKVQDILDGLVKDNLIQEVNKNEDTENHKKDIKYTFRFLEDLLKSRIGIEFNAYKNWCEEEFNNSIKENKNV